MRWLWKISARQSLFECEQGIPHYQEIEAPLAAEQLVRGNNTIEVGAAQLAAGTAGKINLAAIGLVVRY